jgi:A/G-specific adenine glycosylase
MRYRRLAHGRCSAQVTACLPRPARPAAGVWQDRVVMTNGQVAALLRWYESSARDLPWRRPGAGAWAVLVSEIMLQQTPVARVLPAYAAWLARWPTPSSLAAASPADAVRQWGRLGYPRRALRLYHAARLIHARHRGEVPGSIGALRALPGVGSYTAAAVACFGFGQRHAVLDTNVRRVVARLVRGQQPSAGGVSAAETRLAESLLPADPALAARWSVAIMELGALVCTAARPRCDACPVAPACAWRRAGSPAAAARRRGQRYEGTDRQCRGRLLAVLRDADGPVSATRLASAWPDAGQRDRALHGLVTDGLAASLRGSCYALPGELPDHQDVAGG